MQETKDTLLFTELTAEESASVNGGHSYGRLHRRHHYYSRYRHRRPYYSYYYRRSSYYGCY
jgi:hypothetical protein